MIISKANSFKIITALALGTIAMNCNAETLFIDDFENRGMGNELKTLYNAAGYGWSSNNCGNGDQCPVISDDIAHSGTYSLKFTFGGGPDADDAFSEQRYVLGENKNEAYIQWYQYFPSGAPGEGLGPEWQHRNSSSGDNNKMLKLWADVYGAGKTVSTGVSTLNVGDSGDSYFMPVYGTNLSGGTGPFGEPFGSVKVDDSTRGKWLKIQFHLKTASSSNNDGIIKMWIDDKLVLDSHDLPLYPSGGIDNFFRHGYIMGWANSGFAQTSYTYIDDFEISDTFIGANPPSAPAAQ